MKVFYDTEFLEDGRTIDLISIGMVAEDGRELYLVNENIADDESLYDRIRRDRWLMENVIPHLPLRKDVPVTPPRAQEPGRFHLDSNSNTVVPLRFIRNAVREFVLATPDVELWAWYAAYDHVALCQLFGRMINLPAGFPMWTNDLKQECVRLGDPEMPKQRLHEHNALWDARHVAAMWRFLILSESGAPDSSAVAA